MEPSQNLQSPTHPKSPRRQSSKQSTAATDLHNPPPGSLPSSPVSTSQPLRQVHGSYPSKQMAGSGTFLAESPNMEDNDDILRESF